jgi:hypothetical protein
MVQRLRLYWVQQFHMNDDEVTWRSAADLPPAGVRPHTPYDPDARYGGKRMTSWHGYKVHLTETCDDDAPRLSNALLVAPRIGASLFVALDDGFVDGAIEMIGIGESLMGEMMAFQIPPDRFDIIQFRGVFR